MGSRFAGGAIDANGVVSSRSKIARLVRGQAPLSQVAACWAWAGNASPEQVRKGEAEEADPGEEGRNPSRAEAHRVIELHPILPEDRSGSIKAAVDRAGKGIRS